MSSDNPLGLFAWFGFDLPLPERFAMMRAAGFTATALWWGVRHMANLHRLHLVPSLARDAGLTVESIHVPFRQANDLWAEDAAVREPVVAQHCAWVEECARHGVPCMVMHLHTGDRDLPLAPGIDSLRRIVAAAEAAGVTLAVENTRRVDVIDAVLTAIPSPRLRLCYDAAHDRLWSPEPVALLRRWGHRLATVHLADTEGRMDRHLLPGDGAVDWQQMAAAFPRNYIGDLLLEVMPYGTPHLSPDAFLAEAYRRGEYMKQLLLQA
jgi:sugar phosphate isomerase/epimerase